MDGDGQHQASEIKYLLKDLNHNDLVIGSRNLKKLNVILLKEYF